MAYNDPSANYVWQNEFDTSSILINQVVYGRPYLYAAFNSFPCIHAIDPMSMTTVSSWVNSDTSSIVAENITALSGYLYVSNNAGSGCAKVVKIDTSTLTTQTTLVYQSGEQAPAGFANANSFLYNGCSHAVMKIDPSSMTTAGKCSTPGLVLAVTTDTSGFVYAGNYTNPVVVNKIDPTTMTITASYSGAGGEMFSHSIATDSSSFVYCGLDLTPAVVLKIDPITMNKTGTFTGTSGMATAYGMVWDGTNIWVSMLGVSRGWLVAIDPASMNKVTQYVGLSGQNQFTNPCYVDPDSPGDRDFLAVGTYIGTNAAERIIRRLNRQVLQV